MLSFEKIDYVNFYNLTYSVILSSLFQVLYLTYVKYKNKNILFIITLISSFILAIIFWISCYELYTGNNLFKENYYKNILIVIVPLYIIIEWILSYNNKDINRKFTKDTKESNTEIKRIINNREKKVVDLVNSISEDVK